MLGKVGRKAVKAIQSHPGRGGRQNAVNAGKATADNVKKAMSDSRYAPQGQKVFDSMRKHKVRTGMIAAGGMTVAARVRNSGSGTTHGSTSMFRHQ
jgi:hypothetical protein